LKTIDVKKNKHYQKKMKHIITHMATEHDNTHAAIPLRYPQIAKKLNTPARPEQDHRSDLLGTECHETRT
jgi:hypothetical protein